MNVSHVKKLKIALGGTARNPADIEVLHDLKLEFAEIPITNLLNLCKNEVNC